MKASPLIILHAFPIWLPQTQTWMYVQVSELQKLGIPVHVVCERLENIDQFAVDNLHCLAEAGAITRIWDRGLRKLGVRQHLDFIVRVGKDIQADVVHSHFGNIGWFNLGAVRRLKAKHVVTFYGYDVGMLPAQHPVWRARYHELFREADLFLCEGSHMAKCLAELGCPPEKIKVHHLGVDVDNFEFKPRIWRSGEKLRILIAASFREKKGIPYAFEALGLIKKQWPIEVTLIGDSGQDVASLQEKARILQAIKEAGMEGDVRMLGYQSHDRLMREAYDHHLFLHPSVTASDGDTEGGAPVSIIEMLATGMLVVSTAHCDIPEVMGDTAGRLLAPERDAETLSRVISGLLSDTEQWQGLVRANRSRIENVYDCQKQAAVLAGHYETI